MYCLDGSSEDDAADTDEEVEDVPCPGDSDDEAEVDACMGDCVYGVLAFELSFPFEEEDDDKDGRFARRILGDGERRGVGVEVGGGNGELAREEEEDEGAAEEEDDATD